MTIYLIGAGHVAERIIKNAPSQSYRLFDNNKDLQGSYLRDILIEPVEKLKGIQDGLIKICTTSVDEVNAQLMALDIGLTVEIPDEIKEFATQSELINHCPSFLVCSGLPSNNLHGASGGLFLINTNSDSPDIEEIITGPCHGVIRDEDAFVVTAQEVGLVKLNNSYEIVDTYPLLENSRPHGLVATHDKYYVVSSNLDAIIVVDKQSKKLDVIQLSSKFKSAGTPQHHVNDIEIVGTTLYVSMFSVSGSWKQGVFDGGVMQVDLITNEICPINLSLKLPHSVRQVDNNLVICNSFVGDLFSFGKLHDLKFSGFLRGLDYDEKYFYLAESRNRNSTGLLRSSYPVAIDSKINIVDRKDYYSRSISLPSKISEIHSILSV